MRWIYWVQLVLGVWLIVSPWLLGFAEFNAALWNSVFAGTLVTIISFWSLFGEDKNKST